MKIKLTIKDRVLTATLQDNKTAQDFVSLLPLTLTMNDLFGREKFGHLPRAISEGGERTHNYEVGQIVYWSPGPDVAIFYRNDRQAIPDPGIIVIGRLDTGPRQRSQTQRTFRDHYSSCLLLRLGECNICGCRCERGFRKARHRLRSACRG